MLGITHSAALVGVEAVPVRVEVNSGESGDLKLILVGLPDAAVKESQDRVFSAMSNSGFQLPYTRTTINLAPGGLRKEGPDFDLPISIAILAATGQCPAEKLEDYLISGELSLSGAAQPVRGALALTMLARKLGKRGVIIPTGSADEAVLVDNIEVYPVESLDQAVRFLQGDITIQPLRREGSRFLKAATAGDPLDFSDVKGQQNVRRAVEIAVAGGHNLLMIGSPGSGKSMIAKRIPGIMPRPDIEEFLQILSVYSAAGITRTNNQSALSRPFRSPHHTISDVGLLGGGTIPGPGEISLAHNGVLFLDELPEFKRSALEVLRQPLEDGVVTISRSAGKVSLPCSVMLVCAMNPCPCGYAGDSHRKCRCSAARIQSYRSRISGPLLDRIDLHVEAPSLRVQELRDERPGESSEHIRVRCELARAKQSQRLDPKENSNYTCNARLSLKQIRKYCTISKQQGDLLQRAMEELNLSARAYDRILRVARTIADLAGENAIGDAHILEAIQYRSLDRNIFH